jgi:hypothetical protein
MVTNLNTFDTQINRTEVKQIFQKFNGKNIDYLII